MHGNFTSLKAYDYKVKNGQGQIHLNLIHLNWRHLVKMGGGGAFRSYLGISYYIFFLKGDMNQKCEIQ